MGVGVGVWVGQRSSNERGVWGQKQNQENRVMIASRKGRN